MAFWGLLSYVKLPNKGYRKYIFIPFINAYIIRLIIKRDRLFINASNHKERDYAVSKDKEGQRNSLQSFGGKMKKRLSIASPFRS